MGIGLSQREAAATWKVSRNKIKAAIDAGELSVTTTDRRIDPAEMLRVFGEPQGPLPQQAAVPLQADPLAAEVARLQERVARLQDQLSERTKGLEAIIQAKDQTITALQLLTHERAPAKPSSSWIKRILGKS
jgi:hypothetical protein